MPSGLQPEIYLNFREGQIVEGEIADDSLRQLMTDWTNAYSAWIQRFKAPALSF